MSAATLPDPQAAYSHLFGNVHAQTFFGRLAQGGYAPRSEKEAQDLLELSGKLRVVENQQKTASAGSNPYATASAALDKAAAARGITGLNQARVQEHDVAVKQAAATLMADPGIYNAVLSLKAAEAEAVAAQLGLRAPAAA